MFTVCNISANILWHVSKHLNVIRKDWVLSGTSIISASKILASLVKVYKLSSLIVKFFIFCLSPRFELPVKDEGGEKKSMNIVCHYCNQPGHKASGCPSNPHKENFKVSS